MVSKSVLIRASALASTLAVDLNVKAANEETPDHQEAVEMVARTLEHLSVLMAEEAQELDADDV